MAPYMAKGSAGMHIHDNNHQYFPDGGHRVGGDVNARPLGGAVADYHRDVAHYPGGGRQLGADSHDAALGAVGGRNDTAYFVGGGRGGNANDGVFAGIPNNGNQATYMPFVGEQVKAPSSNEQARMWR